MALKYPLVLLVVAAAMALVFVCTKKKQAKKFRDGSKIAGTSFLRNTPYFQRKLKVYKVLRLGLYASLVGAIILATILLAQPVKMDAYNSKMENRDIFLCMDVSASVDELNMELVDGLKNTVKSLRGERFGISIFNTTSIILAPLTDDYDYITNVLDDISKSLKANNDLNFDYDSDDSFYVRSYIYSGTIEGADSRGSSLIGDGLASCAFAFSSPETDRTRIIIFSTDNDLAGTPLVTLDEAVKIAKKRDIMLFGLGTEFMKDDDRTAFKSAFGRAGGKYYDHSETAMKNIISDIEKTSISTLDRQEEIREVGVPEIPFVILTVMIVILILLSRKVVG